ncbi:hypothetical protein BV25DRAFT_1922723 [Artomyces pyxidatus]|uniref:Uncharacterized protein n=1 Tax=Artomyces pyxidatus TaxID=48021 RepID=A0ACB8SD87_9AGAM|nr:hypothetical protein BV25DRAFT_1922723 [Artomyces pyxidatus]
MPPASAPPPQALLGNELPQHKGAFVLEAARVAAPSAWQHKLQAPLRATQASKEMRNLMGVFLLDRFALQAAAPREEAGLFAEDGPQWATGHGVAFARLI